MDSAKLKKILSIVVGIVLILFIIYNSGLLGNKDEGENSGNVVTQTEQGQDAQENQGTPGNQETPGQQSEVSQHNTTAPTPETAENNTDDITYTRYYFRNDKLLTQHYEKHGIEMGFDSKESYEKAASDVINNPKALYKLEAEDGDHVYYVEDTNEFAILSPDGYIRTYFLPSAGKAYFDRQ
ncbi:MAG: hypothetical protein K6E62_10045 [Lachnospiraceae bacterium]|nr:hypothetical protein [Lachnospiraceae bacterium]